MTATLRHQPRAVYAVAFACVVAFMGIGLVDPTRAVGDGSADLESRRAARALVETAVGSLRRGGVSAAEGQVVHVTGHHADAADAVLDVADRLAPTALVVGHPAAHGGELGAPSLTAVLTERSPCDIVVVVPPARVREPVAA